MEAAAAACMYTVGTSSSEYTMDRYGSRERCIEYTSLCYRRYSAGNMYYYLHEPIAANALTDASADATIIAPVVFVHGVAKHVGKNRRILLLELPHVSMKLGQENVPTMDTAVSTAAAVMNKHNFAPALWVRLMLNLQHAASGYLRWNCLCSSSLASPSYADRLALGFWSSTSVGHSLGSCIVAAVIRDKPALVHGLVLIEPVCFLLYELAAAQLLVACPLSPLVVVTLHATCLCLPICALCLRYASGVSYLSVTTSSDTFGGMNAYCFHPPYHKDVPVLCSLQSRMASSTQMPPTEVELPHAVLIDYTQFPDDSFDKNKQSPAAKVKSPAAHWKHAQSCYSLHSIPVATGTTINCAYMQTAFGFTYAGLLQDQVTKLVADCSTMQAHAEKAKQNA
eukprot:1443-Heterococcus_DN1.PRE.1